MAPVCNIAEVALVVNLAKDHLRHGKGKRDSKRKLSVDYASLSAAVYLEQENFLRSLSKIEIARSYQSLF